MKIKRSKSAFTLLAIMVSLTVVAILSACVTASKQELCEELKIIYLRAETYTKAMPDGTNVVMAGYARDSSFGAADGVLSSPGPVIDIGQCATKVQIYFDNNLSEPTSLVINGQTQLNMAPAYYPDGRVRSFTHETPPGNTTPVVYEFPNFRDGTFIYTSGTHPAVQRQMGLYGAVFKNTTKQMAYSIHPYDLTLLLLYSEIDPVIHDAVATDDFGAGKTVSSTIDYSPKYYLVNGTVYDKPAFNIQPAYVGKKILVRLLNAGSKTKTPMLVGAYGLVIAEDGNPYTYPKKRYSLRLAAGQTADAIIVPGPFGLDLFVDRGMSIPNVAAAPGAPALFARLPIGG